MSEVHWIKLTTNMFNDEKIRIIESMPEADTILIIWIKLLVLAGKTNANGFIYLSEDIPYSEDMLSALLNRPVTIIRLALQTFSKFGMIQLNQDNKIYINNWEKHQNVVGLDKIREKTRKRVSEYRKRQKLLENNNENNSNVTSNVTVTKSNAIDIDIEVEEDKEEDKEKDKENTKSFSVPYEDIKNLYNSICISLSKVRSLSPTRKSHIKARWYQFNEDINTLKEAFEKLEKSNFCKGDNERKWCADFDWIIKNDSNMLKTLEGKYDNKHNNKSNNNQYINPSVKNIKKTGFHNFEQTTAKYTEEELEAKLLAKHN